MVECNRQLFIRLTATEATSAHELIIFVSFLLLSLSLRRARSGRFLIRFSPRCG